MPSNFELTQEFHRAIGQLPDRWSGENANAEAHKRMVELRERLIGEEASEAADALHALAQGRGSLTEVAKELADLLCVTYGAAAALGLPMDRIYEQVHASNMTKVGGEERGDGKVLKGKDYQAPDLSSVMADDLNPDLTEQHEICRDPYCDCPDLRRRREERLAAECDDDE
jgi:predicted HAD superfamily Cof-like phosphohydrolase